MEVSSFDRFRSEYPEMKHDDVRDFYKQIHSQYPNQDYFSIDPAIDFFKKTESKRIFELGGSGGALAGSILPSDKNIELWVNIDIDNWKQEITDSRYQFKSSDVFAWDEPIPGNFDTLVMSHVMEHIDTKQSSKLMKRLGSIKWVYIDYPEMPVGGWAGTCAHVNEMDIQGVCAFMASRGFDCFMIVDTGVENSKAMGFMR